MEKINVFWVEIPDYITVEKINEGKILLDDEEQLQYDSYRTFNKKLEYMTGRVLIKSLLSKTLQISPKDICLSKSQYGKPFLKKDYNSERSVSFNISHSERVVACVIAAENNVGIDVQSMSENHINLIDFVLTDSEKFYVKSKEKLTRTQAFFEIWTRKEAYVKAIGKGFSAEPNTISVPFGSQKSMKDNYEYYTCTILDSHILTVSTEKAHKNEFSYQLDEVDFYKIFEYGINYEEYRDSPLPTIKDRVTSYELNP